METSVPSPTTDLDGTAEKAAQVKIRMTIALAVPAGESPLNDRGERDDDH